MIGNLRLRRESTITRNTLWVLCGQGARLLIQAAYFILIARSLGVSQYGAFAAVVALVSIFSPLVNGGPGGLLVKNTARERSLFYEYWGNGLTVVLCSGIVVSILVLCVARWALGHSISHPLIAVVCVSDAVFLPVLDLSALAFQSVERLGRYAQLYILLTVSRVVGVIVLIKLTGHPTVQQWGYVYAASTFFAAITAVALVSREIGRPRTALWRIPRDASEGWHFALGLSAQTVYNDIDKAMLSRLSTLDALGIYAAAYRLIDVSFAPIRAVAAAAYPAFFYRGKNGLTESFLFAKRILVRAIICSVGIAAITELCAPIAPHILGPQYENTVSALRWLAIIPVFRTIHYLTAAALTGADCQRARTYAQVTVAAVNIILNLWLMPLYGWRGAAWSSIASDGLLAVVMYATLVVLRNRESVTTATAQVVQ